MELPLKTPSRLHPAPFQPRPPPAGHPVPRQRCEVGTTESTADWFEQAGNRSGTRRKPLPPDALLRQKTGRAGNDAARILVGIFEQRYRAPSSGCRPPIGHGRSGLGREPVQIRLRWSTECARRSGAQRSGSITGFGLCAITDRTAIRHSRSDPEFRQDPTIQNKPEGDNTDPYECVPTHGHPFFNSRRLMVRMRCAENEASDGNHLLRSAAPIGHCTLPSL